ncbi:hypothetical protein E2C01_009388 [Portunus trituberculatus]|uniref:Uncharacterized protein n=1 Tax=Portunus trituberculatus TaxID=210409 RepID=A0A5B7D4H2_PORTR|nr:hypothetical protein [Portunus trituberculatus]
MNVETRHGTEGVKSVPKHFFKIVRIPKTCHNVFSFTVVNDVAYLPYSGLVFPM